MHISFYMCLIQISLVLADRVDKTILGFALEAPGPATAVYEVVSKPFTQVRQTGWMLAYLVMPAVASLIGARDQRSLERVKYDGTRLHIGMLIPLGTLAWIYAAPFLTLWMGNGLGYDAAREAPLLRLFLIAAVPVLISVPAQMAIGMNRIEVIAISALAGSLVNLPLSYYLTVKLGVSGVIWGTVLTTLFSNFLVPGVYIFRVVGIQPKRFLHRTLGAPACGLVALLAATTAMQAAMPLHPSPQGGMSLMRWMPLAIHLAVASVAYAGGYLAVPTGRTDLIEIMGKFRRRGQG
jgi:O-antigen/teichoic acid export membrane protein